MFAAIKPCKLDNCNNIIQDTVYIYDTADMSFEEVNLDDILASGIKVFGIKESLKLFGAYYYRVESFTCAARKASEYDAVRYVPTKRNNLTSFIFDNTIHLTINERITSENVYINGTHIPELMRATVRYVFRSRCYYIVRFHVVTKDNVVNEKCFSVALDKESNIIAYWGSSFSFGMNLELGIRMDMLSCF